MKGIFLTLALPVLITGCIFWGQANDAVQTVSYVDLNRYMGKWYEIASFPNWFQRGCNCTTAEYTLLDDHVEVKNSCRRGSPEGKLDSATAKAWPVAGTGNAQLKVQFFWPFKGDYWIIALDQENYQYAMVGHPRRKYLWILSRTPSMDDRIYSDLVQKAGALGYDVSRLQKTEQNCSSAEP